MVYSHVKLASRLALALAITAFCGQTFAMGALAIDSNQGSRYGFSHGYDNASQAEQRALDECGSGCQIVLTFEGCGAYAADQAGNSTAYGWATGANAQSLALSYCESRGGTNCIVRVWACD